MSGRYDTQTPQVLYEAATELGLQPQWLTNYGLFSVSIDNKPYYIFYSFNLLNSQLSNKLAQNKHITRIILEKNGLPNIAYSLPQTMQDIESFLQEHKVIVVKPQRGSRSKDVQIIRSMEDIKNINFLEYIFEKYIEGEEFRYLVLNNKVIAVHKSYYETPINNPNTEIRISYPREEWNKAMIQSALAVTNSMSLNFAAVDFIVDKNGDFFILEVNSAPGLWRFHYPSKGQSVNVARMLLEATIDAVKSKNV